MSSILPVTDSSPATYASGSGVMRDIRVNPLDSISVCICTFRRPNRLARLLAALAQQQPAGAIHEIVVVDNDAEGSARVVVESAGARVPWPIRYQIQPHRGIARTRNLAVSIARGDWLALIDDDELPESDWLAQLWSTVQATQADGVLGPVFSKIPDNAPVWIRRGNFYRRKGFKTGATVPSRNLITGNLLIRAHWMRSESGPFNEAFNLTGGEDGDLLLRLRNRGARFVWCQEAAVCEDLDRNRLSLRWLLARSLRGGQNHARHVLDGRFGPMTQASRALFALDCVAKLGAASLLCLASLPLPKHHRVAALRTCVVQWGKLSQFWNSRFEEYRYFAGTTPTRAPNPASARNERSRRFTDR